MIGNILSVVVGLFYARGVFLLLRGRPLPWLITVMTVAVFIGFMIAQGAMFAYLALAEPGRARDGHLIVAFVVAGIVSVLLYHLFFVWLRPATGTGTVSATPEADDQPPPQRDHEFNAAGVCTLCGCGQSASDQPCTG